MKLALGVEYDGSAYHGWQRQTTAASVQACLEEALSKVADHPIVVQCAGRTDTGVHGLGQVVHFETQAKRKEGSWLFGSNANLPDDISVQWVQQVDDDFHARFSATCRTYRYHILNRKARSAILSQKVAWERRPLCLEQMKKAKEYLIGTHDFSAFRTLACQAKSPIRTVYRLDIEQQGPIITMEIEANAFLHHMVRNIAGVLMKIGMKRADPTWAKEVLDGRDRCLGGVTAPAEGLYFIKVCYPQKFNLPEVALPASFNDFYLQEGFDQIVRV